MRAILTALPVVVLLVVCPKVGAKGQKRLHTTMTKRASMMRNLTTRAQKTKVRKATANKARAVKIKIKTKRVKRGAVVPVRHANLPDMHDKVPKVKVTHHKAWVVTVKTGRSIIPSGRSSIHVLRSALEGGSHGPNEATAPRAHRPATVERHRIQPMPPFKARLKPSSRRLGSSRKTRQPSLLRQLQYQMDLLEMSEARR